MLGFKSFRSASATLDGIEVAQIIRKKQFNSNVSGFRKYTALAGQVCQVKGLVLSSRKVCDKTPLRFRHVKTSVQHLFDQLD